MRSKDFGVIPGLAEKFSKDTTLEMFKKICLCRNFELNTKQAYDSKLIKYPVYLSLGKEAISAALSMVMTGPAIFGQHRAHDTYICFGGDLTALVDELLGQKSGVAHGMGGSASIHSPKIKMYGHSGLLGDQIPIAVGYAFGKREPTLAIMGDGAAEEDYVLGAMGYAAHQKLPVFFLCEDNNLSVLTEKEVRRNWEISKVAEGFGMSAIEITDDPWLVMTKAKELLEKMPAFLLVHTSRWLWHAGTGTDGPPEWDRFVSIKEELARLGWGQETAKIEAETKKKIDGLWQTRIKELGLEN